MVPAASWRIAALAGFVLGVTGPAAAAVGANTAPQVPGNGPLPIPSLPIKPLPPLAGLTPLAQATPTPQKIPAVTVPPLKAAPATGAPNPVAPTLGSPAQVVPAKALPATAAPAAPVQAPASPAKTTAPAAGSAPTAPAPFGANGTRNAPIVPTNPLIPGAGLGETPASGEGVNPYQTPTATPPAATNEPRVLLSQVVIEGLASHPERQRLERSIYESLTISGGTEVTRSELRKDLAAIYATGWFSDVRMQPLDTSVGVKLVIKVVPNPVLRKVSLDPPDVKLPATLVKDTFAPDYDRTINLNTLKNRLQDLQKWYADQGYSLARVTGPTRVSPEGEIVLAVRQGMVEDGEVQFLNKEGSSTND